MAVGDPVDPSQIRDLPFLARILARPNGTLSSANNLTDAAIFVSTGPDDTLGRRKGVLGGFRRLLHLHRPAHKRGGREFSLLAALNAVPDVQIYGTEQFGLEAVAVPFGHVAIIAEPNALDLGRLAMSAVRARIEGEFGSFVDPMLGIRTALYQTDDAGEGRIFAFFGRAVFVPGPDDRPVGRITLESQAPESALKRSEPRLPDQRPAGLYYGQSGIAFARSSLSAPATSDVLPAEPIAFVLSAPEADQDIALVARDMTLVGAEQQPSTASLPVIRPAAREPDEDAAFEVFAAHGGERLLRVGATFDTRHSRLMTDRSDEACFAVVAVLAPADTHNRVVDRWWIDLDRRDRLVASAMTCRATSVVCTDDRIEVYDWRERRFDQTQASRFELPRMGTERGRRRMLRRLDGQPFGFVAAPAKTIAASFDQRWWHHDLWAFDWVDFAGAIESPGGHMRRLAADAALTNSAVWVPGLTSSPADSPGITVLDAARDRFAAGGWNGQLASDTTFLVGPLVLTFCPKKG
jgi:hypothetical protein